MKIKILIPQPVVEPQYEEIDFEFPVFVRRSNSCVAKVHSEKAVTLISMYQSSENYLIDYYGNNKTMVSDCLSKPLISEEEFNQERDNFSLILNQMMKDL